MRLLLALLLSGCVVTYRPNAYEWYADAAPSDYYRWEVVDDLALCGRPIADVWRGWACAIRLSRGVILPGDKRIDGGPVTAEEGRLCIIYSTMSEEEAMQRRAKWEQRSLFAHEMQHCAGYAHREVYR